MVLAKSDESIFGDGTEEGQLGGPLVLATQSASSLAPTG